MGNLCSSKAENYKATKEAPKEDFESFVNKYPWHDINKNLVKSVYNEIMKESF